MRECTVGEVLDAIERIFPPKYAMRGDGIGLMTGRRNSRVTRVLVALDPSPEAIAVTKRSGAELLVTHHPFWMRRPRCLTNTCPAARGFLAAKRRGVAVIAAHTNADFAPGGLNDALAGKIGLRRVERLLLHAGSPVGRMGRYAKPMAFRTWIRLLQGVCGSELRWSGRAPSRVARVALCTGSGSELLATAFARGADALLTGDVKYHTARDAEEYGCMRRRGFVLVDAGHFGTEKHFVSLAAGALRRTMPSLDIREHHARPPFSQEGAVRVI